MFSITTAMFFLFFISNFKTMQNVLHLFASALLIFFFGDECYYVFLVTAQILLPSMMILYL
jgi:hypothetical protein